MLPRLQAEEQMRSVSGGQLAAGLYPRHQADEMWRALQREARVTRTASRPGSLADLSAIGITVEADA